METNNPFILAGYTVEQAEQLTKIANQYPQVGIGADESTSMIIKACTPLGNKDVIKFANGRSITALPSSMQQQSYSIISVDISNGKDYSCVVCRCGNCGNVLSLELFNPSEDIYIADVKKCSKCETKFKRSYIFK